ncbi:hypothetical protein J53TS2_26560 [Paenibacillus sp. J53TS2]|uniref:DUF6809 family protein n=1 Tax=Paenibacillus sp. J53TS2 TaxID=2807197 RepID=UPI001B23C4BD|nr:DUF6809 family protein [Paenibacillus sp. J53TS2]GIP49065.1 hypothetical protein J53TS2_26560 [Paenibacillus sp. J53TS2]
MPDFLESLYYGNLLPEKQVVPKDPQYRQLSRELSEAMVAWREKFSSADFTELEALIDLQQKIQGMEMTEAFTNGFKLGAGLMIEVLIGNGPERS